ncbi:MULTISPECIES: glycoside hydrolase family 5 protein [unclassified Roseateles]|uniref:glycoside hydrolase family 5 protein n=1 Tax=unclassified Roseateles TaxID=2626991 RepID=UPI0009E6D8A4|nr:MULTISPECIES: glycoside hydrolase family 5 protein [unclassified Roseateles]
MFNRFDVARLLGLAWLTFSLSGVAQAQGDGASALGTLKRGVNIVGYDAIWTDPTKARFQSRHMQAIRDGGFDHVRLNLHAFAHMDAENRLSAQWFKTLDDLVNAGVKAGLQVILDEHNFNECAKDADLAPCRVRLQAFWRQVAARYQGTPDAVIFEILNEPNGAADPVWNDMLAENLAIIRETNPTRRVIVGPKSWNSLDQLDSLRLPEADRRLIVTFHYYTPMEFTHQGASWTPQFQKLSGVTWGTAADQEKLKNDLDRVKAWADKHQRPILLGEFGALETAGMAQRVAWTAAVARAAEARGFAWSYWQFDSDFVLWDMKADGWVKPIHGALVPEKASAAAPARTSDPALDYLINTPRVTTWSVYGEGQSSQQVPCAATGKVCLRVALQSAKPNVWDIGAVAPLQGSIAKGDKLQVIAWARLDTEDTKAQAVLPMLLQLGTPPYTAVVSGSVTLTSKLEPIAIGGVAAESFAGGTVNLALQLGQIGQPVVLSAPFVLKNYKPAQ